MNEILSKIVLLIQLVKDADNLGINIESSVYPKIKQLAAKLPPQDFGETFIVDGLSVPRPNVEELAEFHKSKLNAVKMYKERTGESLMIAKHALEKVMGK